jgi:hypothetical protein
MSQTIDISCNHIHDKCYACGKATKELMIVRIRARIMPLCKPCQLRLKDLL